MNELTQAIRKEAARLLREDVQCRAGWLRLAREAAMRLFVLNLDRCTELAEEPWQKAATRPVHAVDQDPDRRGSRRYGPDDG